MKKKIMLIDGNSILNRAFYALTGSKMLSAGDGVYTNAVYGFLNIYNRYFEEEKPTHVCVAFDMRAPTLRHKEYGDYKAGRRPMPDELAMQLPLIREVLDAMNITRYELEGYEADDIIGTLSRISSDCGAECVIVTGDRDALQLVGENVRVRIPHTVGGKTVTDDYDTDAVREKYGISPEQMIDVKALMGDSSDNIPGVKGIGEKTALKLIVEFSSLDRLYSAIDSESEALKGISPSVLDKLKTGRESAYMSRRLAQIDRHVPLDENCDVSIDVMKYKKHDRERLLELFRKLRFSTMIKKFGLGEAGDAAGDETGEAATGDATADDAATVDATADGVNETEAVSELNNGAKSGEGGVGIRFEECDYKTAADLITGNRKMLFSYTIGSGGKRLDWMEILLNGRASDGISDEAGDRASDGVNERVNDAVNDQKNSRALSFSFSTDEEFRSFIDCFKSLFESKDINKISHDLKPLMNMLRKHGITLSEPYFDTKIAGYILNPAQKTDDGIAASLSAISQSHVRMSEFISLNQQEKLFYEIETPLTSVLSDMETHGFRLDREELERSGAEMSEKLKAIEKEIWLMAGEIFNINSTKQLATVLYEKLGLPVSKKTKTGYSTDSEVLEELSVKYEIAVKLLEYRLYSKLINTYVNGLKSMIDSETGRIHTSFKQTATATGRLSSTEPNLQNIPVRTGPGKELRKAFVPENDDYILLDADYSQIELRVLAHFTGDRGLIDAFRNGEDIHSATAARVFNVEPGRGVGPDMRSRAKAVNFGIIYGISDYGLARQLKTSRKEAKMLISEYFGKYPGVRDFIDECIRLAKINGFVETMFKRRRYLPELKSTNFNARTFGERAAVNTVIQGTAADIIKIAMVGVYRAFREKGMKSRLILQVHDELIVEAHKTEVDEASEILKSCMENAAELSVPLIAEVKKGSNWYEAK